MKVKENYAAIERTVALVKEKFGADKITIEAQTYARQQDRCHV